MLNNYDDTILMETKKTTVQKLVLTRKLTKTLESHVRVLDDLMRVRHENALMEVEIKALEERGKQLKANLDGLKG